MELRISFLIYTSIMCYWFTAKAGYVDVKDVGYEGTWEEFCDYSNIQNEFDGYTDHDVLRIRRMLCRLKRNNLINREAIPYFCAYKYCNSIRSEIEYFYKKLKDKFNEHFSRKIDEKLTSASPNDECYKKSEEIFNRECMGYQNPCLRMFQSMLSGVCVKPGISVQDIGRYIVDVCDGKYISDKIDWDPITMTINYRD